MGVVRRSAAAALVVLGVSIAGCGSVPSGSGDVSQGDARGIPDAEASIDSYIYGGPELQALQTDARATFMDACMGEEGFEVTPASGGFFGSAEDAEESRRAELDPWWGVGIAEYAQKYGYHEVPMSEFFTVTNSTETAPPGYLEAAMGTDYVAGTTDQVGGCAGEFVALLHEGVSVTETDRQEVGTEARSSARSQARVAGEVVASAERWSECMAREGYSYSDPHAALTEFATIAELPNGSVESYWETSSPTDEEKRVATADATCKANVGFWEVAATASREAVERVVDAMRPRLEELAAANRSLEENAARILASS
ncbi:MAG: hypothetical protein LBK59_04820 [Bifidobacteriaceae bacterium]|jgi:hypothetical protein|nr:hypothetical protein [Bifidobacteriaceae bacterium]